MRCNGPSAGVSSFDVVVVLALVVLALMAVWPQRAVEGVLVREDAAMGTLRELGSRLDAFREEARLDRDGDGRGETPPLSSVLADGDGFDASPDGAAWRRGGYWFTVLAPGPDHTPARPRETAESADAAEATYVLAAWPVEPGTSGMRAYLRTPTDGLLRHAVDGYPYGGPERPPVPHVTLVERRNGRLQPLPLRDSRVWVSPRESTGGG